MEKKDLCESCKCSWIVEDSMGSNKKCLLSGAWLGKEIITDCNCYRKIGTKGQVTFHDPTFEDYEKEIMRLELETDFTEKQD